MLARRKGLEHESRYILGRDEAQGRCGSRARAATGAAVFVLGRRLREVPQEAFRRYSATGSGAFSPRGHCAAQVCIACSIRLEGRSIRRRARSWSRASAQTLEGCGSITILRRPLQPGPSTRMPIRWGSTSSSTRESTIRTPAADGNYSPMSWRIRCSSAM